MATEQKPAEINKPITVSQPDWTIDELYRKAWNIVKKNKLLWVFGLAVGGGASFNNNVNLDGNDIKGLEKLFNEPTGTEQELSRVLGDATSASADIFSYLISAIPVSFYLLLALEFLLLIAASLTISMIYKAWASGALLENIEACIKGKNATITEASEKSFGYLKRIFWLQTFPMFVLFLGILAGGAVLGFGLALGDTTIKILSGSGMFLLTIATFIIYYLLSLSLIWAERQVVISNKSAKQALKDSYNIVKKKSWAMLLLGVVNNIIAGLIIGIPLLIVLGLIVGGIIAGSMANSELALFLIIPGSLLLIAFLIAATIAGGAINAFKATVWSLAYNTIKGKYDGK
jgi:hypothetical protein